MVAAWTKISSHPRRSTMSRGSNIAASPARTNSLLSPSLSLVPSLFLSSFFSLLSLSLSLPSLSSFVLSLFLSSPLSLRNNDNDHVAALLPFHSSPMLADTAAETVDARTVKYLLQAALEKREEEKEGLEAWQLAEALRRRGRKSNFLDPPFLVVAAHVVVCGGGLFLAGFPVVMQVSLCSLLPCRTGFSASSASWSVWTRWTVTRRDFSLFVFFFCSSVRKTGIAGLDTIRPEINSNDFGGFWNELGDSNSNFVVAEIIFSGTAFHSDADS